MKKEINLIIECFIKYGIEHLGLSKYDSVYTRNLLLNRFKATHPYEGDYDFSYIKDLKVADTLLDELKVWLDDNGYENSDLILVEVMGYISPMPSDVVNKVENLEKIEAGKGLDYLFDLSIKNNYIQKSAIDKNIYFKKDFKDNFLEITINLSKPEKSNKDIAKLLVKTNDVKYPKCPLCIENLGFAGNLGHPARGNIRIVPLKLMGEDWFLQYSPYAYFDHHAIIINEVHSNMSINHTTFRKLLEFVNIYPTFFVGSNSDLPIVGGSILNHEHYQAGTHLLPMFYATDRKVYYKDDKVKISTLNWYNSVIRIEGKEIQDLVDVAIKVFDTWINYNDKDAEIVSHTDGVRHSTITPIARKIGDTYSLNLILRNNRCNEEHPDGIFHAHKVHHNIKQESIGLIEAMGLFILPPRLKRQMGYVEEILSGKVETVKIAAEHQDFIVHMDMVDTLIKAHGTKNSPEASHEIVNDFLANTCREILINTATFKPDEKGLKAFDRFLKEII